MGGKRYRKLETMAKNHGRNGLVGIDIIQFGVAIEKRWPRFYQIIVKTENMAQRQTGEFPNPVRRVSSFRGSFRVFIYNRLVWISFGGFRCC